MTSAIRLCGGITIVAFGLFVAIEAFAGGAPAGSSPADCGAGFCDVADADLIALLFALLGSLFATLTGLLVVIAGFLARQTALGMGLALLIFITLAVAIVYVTSGFVEVLFFMPGAYFAPNDQLPWYVAGVTFAFMFTLAPLPSLFFASGWPGPRARSSTPTNASGLRPQILPRLGLTSVLLTGVSLIVLDRMFDHYASVGVGPAWPLLVSAVGFYVFWLVAWILLIGSLLRWRPAYVS